VGTVELKVPRVRDSSYFPSLLEPRRKAEKALAAVVQEAYVHGVSTRKVDELVKALGMRRISKSRVSELCRELDGEVECFRNRRCEGRRLCAGSRRVRVRELLAPFGGSPKGLVGDGV
jgi:transposase-like protein